MSKRGWKRGLLASGVPLEYEVARILTTRGFSVDPDYEFLRLDGATNKEFSVDISTRFLGGTENHITFEIEALIECKYRSQDKFILFFPDPNIEYPSMTLGGTIYTMDQFVPYHVSPRPIYDLEASLDCVYKGVEVHPDGATEQEIRHGVQQLKYAAPPFLKDALNHALAVHPDDRVPKFLLRILLTNMPLKVLSGGEGLASIETAEDMLKLGTEREAVILLSQLGPEFRQHYSRSFSDTDTSALVEQARRARLTIVDAGKKMQFPWDDPVEFADDVLQMGYSGRLFCEQIFVLSLSGLPSFLDKLKAVCRESYRRRRKTGVF